MALPDHDETLPAESAKRMESTCATEAGMQRKSAGFRQRGGEVYLPAEVVSEEVEETVVAD